MAAPSSAIVETGHTAVSRHQERRRVWKGATMSKRTTFWLAWSTWVLNACIAIASPLLPVNGGPALSLSSIFSTLVLLAFATVGALIASRRPENPIGWLFCISTFLWAFGDGLLQYVTNAYLTVSASPPSGAVFLGVVGDCMRGLGSFL